MRAPMWSRLPSGETRYAAGAGPLKLLQSKVSVTVA